MPKEPANAMAKTVDRVITKFHKFDEFYMEGFLSDSRLYAVRELHKEMVVSP